MRKKVTKKQCQWEHFKRRCVLRLGYEMSDGRIKQIIDDIQAGRLLFVEKQSNRVTKYKVNINGSDFVVVYDKQRKTLVTLLFPNEEYICS